MIIGIIASFSQQYRLHEIINYLLIPGFYYLWKYGLKMINVLYRIAIPHKNLKNIVKKV